MKRPARVLVSWVAVNNDPFERQWGKSEYRLIDGEPVPGPTLTVLLDDESRAPDMPLPQFALFR